jgi:anti-sigma-K factor RskA
MRRRLFWLMVLTAAAAAAVAYRMKERARTAVRRDAWPTHESFGAPSSSPPPPAAPSLPTEEGPAETPPMVVATMEAPAADSQYEGNGSAVVSPDGAPAQAAEPQPDPGAAFRAPVGAAAGRPLEQKRKRRLSSATLAALGMVAGLGAIALGAWGVASSVSDNGSSPATTEAAQNVSQVVSLIAKPTTTTIPLQGSGRRIILVVGAKGYGVLVLNSVQQPPAGKTYEAWVIRPNVKAPQPAGLFAGGTKVVKLTKPVPAGGVVAITVEPAGGSPAPTQKPKLLATRT